MYCSECHFFSDLGRCKNPASNRSDVGYFQAACRNFKPESELQKVTVMEKQEETKVCKVCGRELPLSEFPRNKNGHIGVCKECRYRENRSKNSGGKYGIGQKPLAVSIAMFTDNQLLEELKERGWHGQLSKEIKYEL